MPSPTCWKTLRNIPRLRMKLLVLFALSLLVACATSHTAQLPAYDRHADIVLLGEVHDNPEGHRQRLALLQGWVEAGWRPALVMEQFDREQQATLDAAMARCATADCVIQAVVTQKSTWDWGNYRALITLALRFQLPLLAGNVSRADAGKVMHGGLASALDTATMVTFGVDRPLPDYLQQSQRNEIVEGHCHMLPENMVAGMVNAQLARDIWMAKLLNDHARRGVVLLAGNGHVRRDVGVGHWLQGVTPVSLRSVGFVEAGAHYPAGAFDEMHVLALQPRPDPCAGLAQHLAEPHTKKP